MERDPITVVSGQTVGQLDLGLSPRPIGAVRAGA